MPLENGFRLYIVFLKVDHNMECENTFENHKHHIMS